MFQGDKFVHEYHYKVSELTIIAAYKTLPKLSTKSGLHCVCILYADVRRKAVPICYDKM